MLVICESPFVTKPRYLKTNLVGYYLYFHRNAIISSDFSFSFDLQNVGDDSGGRTIDARYITSICCWF